MMKHRIMTLMLGLPFLMAAMPGLSDPLIMGEFRGRPFSLAEYEALTPQQQAVVLPAIEYMVYSRAGRWVEDPDTTRRAEWLLRQPQLSEAGKMGALRTLLARPENRRTYAVKVLGDANDPTSRLMRSIYTAQHENVFQKPMAVWLEQNPTLEQMHDVLTALQLRQYESFGEDIYRMVLSQDALTDEERVGFVRLLTQSQRGQLACPIWKELDPKHPGFESLRKSLLRRTSYSRIVARPVNRHPDLDPFRSEEQRREAINILFETHPPTPEQGEAWLFYTTTLKGDHVVRGQWAEVLKTLMLLFETAADPRYHRYNFDRNLAALVLADREYTHTEVFLRLKPKALALAGKNPTRLSLQTATVAVIAAAGDFETSWKASQAILHHQEVDDEQAAQVLISLREAPFTDAQTQKMADLFQKSPPLLRGSKSLEALLRLYAEAGAFQGVISYAHTAVSKPKDISAQELRVIRNVLELYDQESLFVDWMNRNQPAGKGKMVVTGSETIRIALQQQKGGQVEEGFETMWKAMSIRPFIWAHAVDSAKSDFHALARSEGFAESVRGGWAIRKRFPEASQPVIEENIQIMIQDLMKPHRESAYCVIAAEAAPNPVILSHAFEWFTMASTRQTQLLVMEKANQIYQVAVRRYPECRPQWERLRSKTAFGTSDYDEALFLEELIHMEKNLSQLHPACLKHLAQGAGRVGQQEKLKSFFARIDASAPKYPVARGAVFAWKLQEAQSKKARKDVAEMISQTATEMLAEGALVGNPLTLLLKSPPKGVDPKPALESYSALQIGEDDFVIALQVAEAAGESYPDLALLILKKARATAAEGTQDLYRHRCIVLLSSLKQHQDVITLLGTPQDSRQWKHTYLCYRLKALAGLGDVDAFQEELKGADGPSLDGKPSGVFAFLSFREVGNDEVALRYYSEALQAAREKKGPQYANIATAAVDIYCRQQEEAKAYAALFQTLNAPHIHKRSIAEIEKAYHLFTTTFPSASVDFSAWEQMLKSSGVYGKNQQKVLANLRKN